jgi:hypothetical protein
LEPAPEGSRVLVYRREPGPEDLYEVGEWRGVPHFRCRRCAFDTLVAGNMLAHLDCHGSDVADGLDELVMAGSEPATNVLEVEDNAYSS